jgi:hypothetical protein
LNEKSLDLFGPTICTWWNGQDRKKKDELIYHMVNLFDNTFNKKVVTKLANENLTRAQYREKLRLYLKNECSPMVLEKEWKTLIEDAKENFLKKKEDIHELVKKSTTHVILL